MLSVTLTILYWIMESLLWKMHHSEKHTELHSLIFVLKYWAKPEHYYPFCAKLLRRIYYKGVTIILYKIYLLLGASISELYIHLIMMVWRKCIQLCVCVYICIHVRLSGMNIMGMRTKRVVVIWMSALCMLSSELVHACRPKERASLGAMRQNEQGHGY